MPSRDETKAQSAGLDQEGPASEARPLADSAKQFQVLIENSPDVIMSLDRRGTILFINHTLPEYSVEEVTGTNVLDYLEGDDRSRYAAALHRVFQEESPQTIELRAIGPTWWFTRLIRIDGPTDGDGGGATALAIATDITERKRAEEALRDSENRFRELAETTTAAIFIFQGAKMIYANRASEHLTGYTQSELADMNFWDVIHPDYRDLVKTRGMARQRGEDVPSRFEVKLETKTGEERWVDYAGSLFEYGGQPAVVGTAIDVTARKRAEEQRQKLESQVQHTQKLESLGVLAGGIAHDFNNLLTGILGSASLAAMKVPENSPAKEQLDRILAAAEKAAELTNQMLAYAGKGRFVMGSLDVNALASDLVPLVRTSISKKTELRTNFAENLPTIEGDRTQLQQVVMNLITNASESLEGREGVVTIRTGAMRADLSPEEDPYVDPTYTLPHVFIEVTDNGIGMDEKTKKKIFDPFFTTKFTGRGLGLAAVQGIVRAHRGRIRVESTPNHGTTFTVLFPTSSHRALREDAESEPASGGRRCGTVLVIDDEDNVRDVARQSLEEAGYLVLSAGDGEEAIRLFEERADEIAAVLLDMSMPHMSGDETLDALRAIRPRVPVVLTSGYSEDELSRRFAGKGLAGFVRKPFRATELVERIGSVLADSARE